MHEIDRRIKELWEQKLSWRKIARTVGMSRGGVTYRARAILGLDDGTSHKAPSLRKNAWPPEKLEKLKQLWEEGYTAREIADVIKMSRNSVIGKARREKFSSKAKGKPHSEARKRRASPKITLVPRPHTPRQPPMLIVEPPRTIDGGVSIMELQLNQCRDVIGRGDDGLARYCGNEATIRPVSGVLTRQSFCEWHYRKYYARPTPR